MDLAIPADSRVKLREWEKRNKYLDLASKLKRFWNMKVRIIPIVIGAHFTGMKGLLQGLEDLEITGRVQIIQTSVLLESARMLNSIKHT